MHESNSVLAQKMVTMRAYQSVIKPSDNMSAVMCD